jgi:hypothetical protein
MGIQSGGPHAQTFQNNDWDFKILPGSKAFAIGYDGNTERTADQAEIDFSYYPFGQ